MSTKAQQGAAESRERDQAMAPRVDTGRFGRLRRLPGFRTAAVAFLLTVVLGLGGTAAYAYWSASTAATITVTPMPNIVKPPAPWCTESGKISWSPAAGLETDAAYVLTFTVGAASKSYAVPRQQLTVNPSELQGLRSALGTTNGRTQPMAVSLRTALPKSPVSGVIQVQEPDISFPSERVQMWPTTMSYTTKNSWLGPYAEFGCR
ncbi:hypothetical protein [Arthrobacter sp. zg-Y750]|uniref:hypothetical protein n=1 Tax=Arthrobacter sp. zg-Y750 TaxID=2894189 RepID=UPI001E2FA919|nr:hypothetical protein [Arthrobacter sp. zg-Y750]MCC9179002.1 hypothetical protein [Arthrobacter sp. zg-Y750]